MKDYAKELAATTIVAQDLGTEFTRSAQFDKSSQLSDEAIKMLLMGGVGGIGGGLAGFYGGGENRKRNALLGALLGGGLGAGAGSFMGREPEEPVVDERVAGGVDPLPTADEAYSTINEADPDTVTRIENAIGKLGQSGREAGEAGKDFVTNAVIPTAIGGATGYGLGRAGSNAGAGALDRRKIDRVLNSKVDEFIGGARRGNPNTIDRLRKWYGDKHVGTEQGWNLGDFDKDFLPMLSNEGGTRGTAIRNSLDELRSTHSLGKARDAYKATPRRRSNRQVINDIGRKARSVELPVTPRAKLMPGDIEGMQRFKVLDPALPTHKRNPSNSTVRRSIREGVKDLLSPDIKAGIKPSVSGRFLKRLGPLAPLLAGAWLLAPDSVSRTKTEFK